MRLNEVNVSFTDGLRDKRVLELSAGLAGQYCGHVFAGLGAAVTRVRTSADDVHPLDAKKNVVAFDPSTQAGFETLAELAAGCDLFIEDRAPLGWPPGGAVAPRLVARLPRLIAVCIAPFGRTGPHADYAAYPLNCYHAGGNAQQIPCDALRPDFRERAPLQAGGQWGEANAGTLAAVAALACLLEPDRFAGTLIDCSKQEALISYNWTEAARFPNERRSPSRLAPLATIVGGIQPAADGFVQIAVREDHQWAALAQLLEHPEWADDPNLDTRAARIERWQAVARLIARETRKYPVQHLHRRGRELGIPIAAVCDVPALLADADLAARGAWERIDLPGDTRITLPRWDTSIRAPADTPPVPAQSCLAQSSLAQSARPARGAPGRPLAGLRVVDLGWVAMGPYAGYVLASLGAEVIHVTRPPAPAPVAGGVDLAAYNYGFDTLNTGKTWVGIDLKNAEGRALLHAIVAKSDVVLENFRPGVCARLGIDYPALSAINRRLVMLSASTYGERAIAGAYVGYAPVFAALGGLAHLTGYPDGPPSEVSHPVDFFAGSVGVIGILAGLHRRDATGAGCHIDLAAREAVLWSLGHEIALTQLGRSAGARTGNTHPALSPHGVYRCRGDNKWISIAVGGEAEWQRLCGAIDAQALASDARFATAAGRITHRGEIDAAIERFTSAEDVAAVCERLQAAGVAAFPTVASEDLWNDRHLHARGVYRSRETGGATRWYVAPPWAYSDGGRPGLATVTGTAAARAVFGELLGLPDARIQALREAGVISLR